MSTAGVPEPTSPLERHARLALRAYPPGYRADRGEEILGTIMEATPPGWRWPPARELTSLLRGGISARRVTNAALRPAVSLRQTAVLAIALYFSGMLNNNISLLSLHGWRYAPQGWNVLLPLVPLAATVAAAWTGRRKLTAAAAVAAVAALACPVIPLAILGPEPPQARLPYTALTVPVLMLVALVLLAGGSGRPPRSWLWLAWIPAAGGALSVAAARLPGTPSHLLGGLGFWGQNLQSVPVLTVLMAAVGICWLATDPRPLLALALAILVTQRAGAAGFVSSWANPAVTGHHWEQPASYAAWLAVAGVITWRLLRRPRAALPTAG